MIDTSPTRATGDHNTAPIRILIADDHAMVRASLQRIVDSEPDMAVLGTGSDGATTLAALAANPVDVLLLDLSMPEVAGTELVATIRASHPQMPILVVSMFNSPHVITAAMRAGASGYITKDSEPEQLLEAIRQVHAGATWLGPGVMQAMLHSGREQGTLSPREDEILRLLARGQSNGEIARLLGISEKTVSTHKINLMTKLGVTNIAALVRYVQDNALLFDLLSTDIGNFRD